MYCSRAVGVVKLPWKDTPRNEANKALENQLHSRPHGTVHLTHNDLDAVGCDAIHRRIGGQVTTIFCSVGRFPHVMGTISRIAGEGDTLSISDLGYYQGAEGVVDSIRNRGWRVEWRDHHRWRDEEFSRVEKNCDLLHVRVDTCATGICAQDLAPDDPVATEVAMVVCDYDLWIHADPRSAILGQVLQRKKNRDYVRDCLVQGVFSDDYIMEQSREIRAEMERQMEKSIQKAQVKGDRYRIAFAPLYGYPSETAAEMRKALSTDMEVLISPSGRFSLRSVPPVSHILARSFGGGGHPNAAGGNFPFSFWESLYFRLFGRSASIERFVEIAESLE